MIDSIKVTVKFSKMRATSESLCRASVISLKSFSINLSVEWLGRMQFGGLSIECSPQIIF